MTLLCFEGRDAGQDPHAGGLACDSNTLPLEREEAPGYNVGSDSCSAYAEEATPLYREYEGRGNLGKRGASSKGVTQTLKSNLINLTGLAEKKSHDSDAFTDNHLESATTLVSSCTTARSIHTATTSLTATSSRHEDETDNPNGIGRTGKDATLKRRAAPTLRGPPCASQHVVVDVQALHALQERLLLSEEKLWLTQRQLVDEQGKEVHLKSQILFLEDEIERAQAEGLANATRYAEQVESLQQLHNKITRLEEENDSLESCLSEKISEGRALQELAERLILRLGKKTDALLEEGICVTRVLAPAWNRQELLAELKKKNLLRSQLAHVALFYCSDGSTESHEITKTGAFPSLEKDPVSLQAPVFASPRTELLPSITGTPATGRSLPACATCDTQTTGASSTTAAADRPAAHGPPPSDLTRDASLSGEVLTADRSDPAAAAERLERQDICSTSQLRQSAGPTTHVNDISTLASAAADRLRRGGECQGADPSLGASFARGTPARQTVASPLYSSREENAAATTGLPSDCLRALTAVSLVGDAAAVVSAQQPNLRSSESSSTLECEKHLTGERERKTREVDGPSSPNCVREADRSLYATPETMHAANACAAVHPDLLPAAAGPRLQGDSIADSQGPLLDAKPTISCHASDIPAWKTEETSASVRFPLREASRRSSPAGLENALWTRSTHLQRVRSEAPEMSFSYNRFSTSLSPKVNEEKAGVTTDRRQSGGGETFVSPCRNDSAERGIFGLYTMESSCQGSQEMGGQRSRPSSEPEGRVHLGTWSGAANESADSFSLKNHSDFLKKTGEGEHMYLREERTPLALSKSDCAAAVRGTESLCGDGTGDRAPDKTVGQAALPADPNSAPVLPQKKQTSRPISENKHGSSLQPPSGATPNSRLTPAYSGGSRGLAAEWTAAAVDSKRLAASLEKGSVAAPATGAKEALQSPQAAAAEGGKEVNGPSQTTPRGTLRTDCPPSPRAAAAALVTAGSPVQPAQHESERLQMAQQGVQLAARQRNCGAKLQPLPQRLISYSTPAVKKEDEETQLNVVGGEGAPREAGTAVAVLPADTGVSSGGESSCVLKSEERLTCASASLYAPDRLASRESQAISVVAARTRSVAEGEAKVYDDQERKTEQVPCSDAKVQDNKLPRKSSSIQLKDETGHEDEFCFPLDCPPTLTEGPPQAPQLARTDFPIGVECQARLLTGVNHLGNHRSCTRLLPFEVQKNSSRRKSFTLNSETLTFVQAGARSLSLGREKALRSGQRNTHTSNAQGLPSAPGGDSSTAECPTPTENEETMATRLTPAASRLPPLPQQYQSKLAPASTLTAESKGYSSSPVICQASRRLVATNGSRREPSASGARLLKRLNAGGSTPPAYVGGKVPLWRENGSSRRSSQCLGKANGSVEVGGKQETLNNNIFGNVPSVASAEPRVSLYSSGSAAEPAVGAASFCANKKSLETRQPPLGSRGRSHSTVKAGATRMARAEQQGSQQREEQQDLIFSPVARAAARQATSQLSGHLITGDKKSAYNGVDGEAFGCIGSSLVAEDLEAVSSGASGYDSSHSEGKAKCCGGSVKASLPHSSASSFGSKSVASSEVCFCEASSRRLSLLHTGTHGGKASKARGARTGGDMALQTAMRRSNSAFMRRTSTASHAAVCNSKKKKEASSHSGTHLDSSSLASSPTLPLSGGTSRTGQCSSRSNASGSSSISSVHNRGSDVDDLVYHEMPATERGTQPATAAPALCIEQRSSGDKSTGTGESRKRKDVHIVYNPAFRERAPEICARPSSAGDDHSFRVTSDKSCTGSQQQGQRYATSAGPPYFDSEVSLSRPAADNQEQSSYVGVVSETDKTSSAPAAVTNSISLLAPTGGAASADLQEPCRKHIPQRTDLRAHAPAEGRTASAEAAPPTAAPPACRYLPSRVPLTGLHASSPVARSSLGTGAVEYTLRDLQKQTDGEQQQDQQQTHVNYAATADPPSGTSTSSSVAYPGEQTASSMRAASLRTSLPLPSGTGVPAHLAHSAGNQAAGMMSVESLESKDAPRRTEAAERGGDWFGTHSKPAAFPVGALDQQKLRASRGGLQIVSRQLRSEALAQPMRGSLPFPSDPPDSAAGRQKDRTSRNTPCALIDPSDTRALGGKQHAALRDMRTELDRGQLNTQQGIREEKADTPRLAVCAVNGSPAPKQEEKETGFQQNNVKAEMPSSTAESDAVLKRSVRTTTAYTTAAGGFVETTHGKAGQEGSSKGEGLANSRTRYTAPSVIQAPTTYSATAGNKYSPFGLHQRPATTSVYRPTFCGMCAAAPAAALTYGAAPAALSLCSRSSVPLQQQQSRNRTVQQQELQQQQQRSAATADYQQEQGGHTMCSQQEQPQYLVDRGTHVRIQPWQALQSQESQQFQAPAQLPQCKEQLVTTQVVQPMVGSWQCHRQQQAGVQQQQRAQQQRPKHHTSGSALPQAVARQPLQHQTMLQHQMQQRQNQPMKLAQSRSQPSRVTPAGQFMRQTLPRRGAENALGSPRLSQQQQTEQQQGMTREKLRQQQIATSVNGKAIRAAASDQQSPCDSRRVSQLQPEQQRQKKCTARLHQQRRSTIGPLQQDTIDLQEENQHPHILTEKALPVHQQTVRQGHPQEFEGLSPQTRQQLSQAGSPQQQQMVPSIAERRILGGPNVEQLNHTHGSLKAQLQDSLSQQVRHAKEGLQLQQQSMQPLQQVAQQQQSQSSQGGLQLHAQHLRYPWGTAIHEQHLQPQAKHLHHYQQQQPPHTMSMRWSCGVLSRATQELQEPLSPQQQMQHRVQPQVQMHHQLPQQQWQQQLQVLNPDGQHQPTQLQQLQQQTQPKQLQPQRTQQQLLQQHFWNVVQMYHRGALPICTEKGHLTGVVYNTSGRPSLINSGTYPVNHKAFACDSRATISAAFNRNTAVPEAAFQLPSGESQRPPSTTVAFNGSDTSFLLNRTYWPVASSLPSGVSTIQASRLSAPVFPAATAATSKGRTWQRQ